MVARIIAAIAVLCASIRTPPETSGALSAAITDWASIVLAALPYVVIGAIAAWVSRRLVGHGSQERHHVVALIAMLNPGCDCALNGFASALARARPSLAGFALTFGAAASPVSLAVSYSAFGARITVARAAGALVAAALTALAWSLIPFEAANSTTSVGATVTVGHTDHQRRSDHTLDLQAALGGIAFAAAAAIAAKILAPPAALAHLAPAGAALLGALLSPCSTADPVLAAALLREPRAQLAFMLAAQCLDVRQLLLMLRHFGAARAGAAAACAAGACAIATWFV